MHPSTTGNRERNISLATPTLMMNGTDGGASSTGSAMAKPLTKIVINVVIVGLIAPSACGSDPALDPSPSEPQLEVLDQTFVEHYEVLPQGVLQLDTDLFRPLLDFQNRQSDKELLLLEDNAAWLDPSPRVVLGGQMRLSALAAATSAGASHLLLGYKFKSITLREKV